MMTAENQPDPDRIVSLRGRARFLAVRPSSRPRASFGGVLSARGPLLLRTAGARVLRNAPPLSILPDADEPADRGVTAAGPSARFFRSLADEARPPGAASPGVPPKSSPPVGDVTRPDGRALAARLERDDPPLVPATSARQFLADRLGLRPPRVLVHVGPAADRLARVHGADAVSFSDRVAFRHRQYRPETPAGLALLGHEMTHIAHEAAAPAVPPGGTERQALANETAIRRDLAPGFVTATPPPAQQGTPSPVHAAREDRPLAAVPTPADGTISDRELARIKDAVFRDLRARIRSDFERGS